MLHVLNQDSCFFAIWFDILNKLATIVYSLCFEKQTIELLLHLSFKAELPKMTFKIFLSWF